MFYWIDIKLQFNVTWLIVTREQLNLKEQASWGYTSVYFYHNEFKLISNIQVTMDEKWSVLQRQFN